MPVMDGDETLRLLRADPRHQFLPVIVVTAHYGDRCGRKRSWPALTISSPIR